MVARSTSFDTMMARDGPTSPTRAFGAAQIGIMQNEMRQLEAAIHGIQGPVMEARAAEQTLAGRAQMTDLRFQQVQGELEAIRNAAAIETARLERQFQEGGEWLKDQAQKDTAQVKAAAAAEILSLQGVANGLMQQQQQAAQEIQKIMNGAKAEFENQQTQLKGVQQRVTELEQRIQTGMGTMNPEPLQT